MRHAPAPVHRALGACLAIAGWLVLAQAASAHAQTPPSDDETEQTGAPVLDDCPGGMVPAPDAPQQCCWPGQRWSGTTGRCEGVPRCPSGLVVEGETCVPALSAEVRAPPLPPPDPPGPAAVDPDGDGDGDEPIDLRGALGFGATLLVIDGQPWPQGQVVLAADFEHLRLGLGVATAGLVSQVHLDVRGQVTFLGWLTPFALLRGSFAIHTEEPEGELTSWLVGGLGGLEFGLSERWFLDAAGGYLINVDNLDLGGSPVGELGVGFFF